ncbi:MAG: hypothetical protein AAGI23_00940 [Bacteroidota bacterium]
MKIMLHEVESGELIEGLISKAKAKELPSKKAGWQFSWRKLGKTEGADLYKVTSLKNPQQIEGLLMLTLMNEEMLYMNNLEVAPHNYESSGKYSNVAGGLIAFACHESLERGKNYYLGYLSFDSKTQLIELYQNKYGATLAMGQKMFFDPEVGKSLMKKHLSIEI